MNVNIKYYLVSSVPKEKYRPLFIRCTQGAFDFTCLYTLIKYFPLVIASLVQNTTPILVSLLIWKLYKIDL